MTTLAIERASRRVQRGDTSDIELFRVHAPVDAYTRIHPLILNSRRLTPNAKVLIVHLIDRARTQEVFDIDREVIAEWLGSGHERDPATRSCGSCPRKRRGEFHLCQKGGDHRVSKTVVDDAIRSAKRSGFLEVEQSNNPADGRIITHWYVTESPFEFTRGGQQEFVDSDGSWKNRRAAHPLAVFQPTGATPADTGPLAEIQPTGATPADTGPLAEIQPTGRERAQETPPPAPNCCPPAEIPPTVKPTSVAPATDLPATGGAPHMGSYGACAHGPSSAASHHGGERSTSSGRTRNRKPNAVGGPCIAHIDDPSVLENTVALLALYQRERQRGSLDRCEPRQFVAAAVRTLRVEREEPATRRLALFARLVNNRARPKRADEKWWGLISEAQWKEADERLREYEEYRRQWRKVEAIRVTAQQTGLSPLTVARKKWPDQNLTQEDWGRLDETYPPEARA